jgi:dihydropteroate synthase
MARVAASHDVPLVITHNGWALPPRPPGQGLMAALLEFFRMRIAQVESLGVRRVIVDPGYGFGKTLEENLILIRSLNGLRPLRRPVLICTSRKGSLGRIVGEPEPRERLGATLATSLFSAFQGANLVRVHDVKPFRQALQAWVAVKSAPREGGE